MKITIGEWKTRGGRKAIVAADSGVAFQGSRFIGWISEGVFWWDDVGTATAFGGNTPYDLIAPWTDPVPWDWSTTTPWINWIAMDETTSWFMYDFEPEMRERAWVSNRGSVHLIPSSHSPKWSGDWKLSKTMRPKEVAK